MFKQGVVVESEAFFVLESINEVPIDDFLLKNTDLTDITMSGKKYLLILGCEQLFQL